MCSMKTRLLDKAVLCAFSSGINLCFLVALKGIIAFGNVAWVDCAARRGEEQENSFVSCFANALTCFEEGVSSKERYRLSLSYLNNTTDETIIFFDNANNPNMSECNSFFICFVFVGCD